MTEAAAPSRAGMVLARGAVLAVAALAVPVVGVAAVLHGTAGLTGAAAGLALVLVLFGASALLHAWAGGLPNQVWAAVMAAGFAGRLALYTLALAGLALLDALHWPSLALATAVGFVVTLAVEVRALMKRPELFWLRTSAEGADR